MTSQLQREPFEFCAPPPAAERPAGRGSAGGSSGGSAVASSSQHVHGANTFGAEGAGGTAPQRPAGGGPQRSALLAHLTSGGSTARAGAAPSQPGVPVAPAAPPQPATPTSSSPGGSPGMHQQQAQQQQPEKKKKKHGRLWHLLYGEHDTGMHQGWD